MKKYFLFFLCIISILSCNNFEDSVSQNEIIQLKIYDFEGKIEIDAALGDGETIITLIAKIPVNARPTSRTVKFRASNGATFEGIEEGLDTEIVNSDGIATTYLKLPLDNNPVFISAEVISDGITYRSEGILNLIGVGEVITLQILDMNGNILTSSPRADGFTLVRLKATVNYNQAVFNQVTFQSSSGTFQSLSNSNSVQNIDNKNIATLDLKLPITADRIYVSAEVGSATKYFDNAELDVLRANPDKVIIEPTNLIMKENESNSIDVFLKREVGQVSQATGVSFESFQLVNGVEIGAGRFTGLENSISDANGKVTVQFKTDTGDFNISLPVYVRVSAHNDKGELIQSSITITLN